MTAYRLVSGLNMRIVQGVFSVPEGEP